MTITWFLYRTKQGSWVVYSDVALTFTHADRNWIEKRLTRYGVRPAEIKKLFEDEMANGEGRITVPIGLEKLQGI